MEIGVTQLYCSSSFFICNICGCPFAGALEFTAKVVISVISG